MHHEVVYCVLDNGNPSQENSDRLLDVEELAESFTTEQAVRVMIAMLAQHLEMQHKMTSEEARVLAEVLYVESAQSVYTEDLLGM